MNSGIISSRYAKSLLRFTDETGNGEAVYTQVLQILKDPDSMPAVLEPELQKFIQLLVRNGRIDGVKQMLTTFTRLYNTSRGRRIAHLVTAVPAGELEIKVKSLLESRLGGEIVLDSGVDPSIIGGFVLTVDDYLLDASVSRQLEEIRRQFMDKNKRIV